MEARLFEEGTVPEWVTPAWYAGRDRAAHLDEPMHQGRLRTSAEFASRSGQPVVDLGAGDGGLLSLLEVKCWGYDLQATNIIGAHERGVDVSLLDVVAHPEQIAWAPVVVCTEMLEHLLEPHRFVAVIAEHAEVLVASSPAFETPKSHYAFHTWAWDLDGYRAMLEGAGFRIGEQVVVDDYFQVVRAVRSAVLSPEYCLAARLGGPDHQPYLCQREHGHTGTHQVTRGDWSYAW